MASPRRRRKSATFPCPHCGEPVKVGRSCCRECGSDARTGWSEGAEIGGLDLPAPMADAEYEEFLAREFPAKAGKRAGKPGLAWKIAVVLLAFLFLLVQFLIW